MTLLYKYKLMLTPVRTNRIVTELISVQDTLDNVSDGVYMHVMHIQVS